MPSRPGFIILLGSGETSPSIRTVYHWLFEQLGQPVHTAILETPAGFEPNSDQVAGQIGDFLKKRLQNFQPKISIIPARKRGTNLSPDDPDLARALYPANVIMMGPGSPTYAVRQLQNSVLWHTLTACHRLGASLIFASAATIASSVYALPVYEIYKVGEDLHWKAGLNLFSHFGLALTFIPHWNNNDGGADLDTSRCYMGRDRYNQLMAMLPAEETIVGVDENTALIIDPTTEQCRVLGTGKATVIRQGQKQSFPSGEVFPVQALGPFRCPDPQAGIPPTIWEQAQASIQAMRMAETEKPTPPPEIIQLVAERTEARRRKDWATADRLRDQIEATGWKVLDTSDGPALEQI